MFTTPTGQTGTDAFQYEAAQIANALRKLNERAHRLAEAMVEELDGKPFRYGMPSARYPDATVEGKATEGFLMMQASAQHAEFLGRVARGIADPNYVVRFDI